jgi:glycine betaine/proline transport system permease protein
MVGVNQVIMLSLNMVIIASMIGAGGLGFDVLAALRRLDIGRGLEARAFAIVALAIALDRLEPGLCDLKASQPQVQAPEAANRLRGAIPITLAALALVVVNRIAGS